MDPRPGRRGLAALASQWITRALVLAALAALVRVAFPPRAPDVLLIVMDTTRADRCSFLGYERPTTPRLDELAKSSVVFHRTWSPSPWTVPSHAALFTGVNPERLGMVDSDELGRLPGNVPTLAEHLAQAQYATACFTNNAWLAAPTGLTRGFHEVRPIFAEAAGGSAVVAHERALAWMRERRREGRRFFAMVNDMEPHTPWDPPESVAARFLDPSIPAAAVEKARSLTGADTIGAAIGREQLSDDVRRAASDLYDAEIATLDAAIGSLLDAMEAEGLLEDTVVVITSDHGEGLADHGWWEHGLDLHREVLRVPLLVRPAGGTRARRVCDLTRLEDVAPTVLALCGVDVPEGLDGVDLLEDELAGRFQVSGDRARASWLRELERRYGLGASDALRVRTRSVCDGTWHLILDDRGGVRLYDVKNDPRERNDVAASRPEVVARLRNLLTTP